MKNTINNIAAKGDIILASSNEPVELTKEHVIYLIALTREAIRIGSYLVGDLSKITNEDIRKFLGHPIKILGRKRNIRTAIAYSNYLDGKNISVEDNRILFKVLDCEKNNSTDYVYNNWYEVTGISSHLPYRLYIYTQSELIKNLVEFPLTTPQLIRVYPIIFEYNTDHYYSLKDLLSLLDILSLDAKNFNIKNPDITSLLIAYHKYNGLPNNMKDILQAIRIKNYFKYSPNDILFEHCWFIENKPDVYEQFNHCKLTIPRSERQYYLALIDNMVQNFGLEYCILSSKPQLRQWSKMNNRLHPGEFKNRYPNALLFFKSLLAKEARKQITKWYSDLHRLIKEGKPIETIVNHVSSNPEEFAKRFNSLLNRAEKEIGNEEGCLLLSNTLLSDNKISSTSLLKLLTYYTNELNNFQRTNLRKITNPYRLFISKCTTLIVVLLKNKQRRLPMETLSELINLLQIKLLSNLNNKIQSKTNDTVAYIDPMLYHVSLPLPQIINKEVTAKLPMPTKILPLTSQVRITVNFDGTFGEIQFTKLPIQLYMRDEVELKDFALPAENQRGVQLLLNVKELKQRLGSSIEWLAILIHDARNIRNNFFNNTSIMYEMIEQDSFSVHQLDLETLGNTEYEWINLLAINLKKNLLFEIFQKEPTKNNVLNLIRNHFLTDSSDSILTVGSVIESWCNTKGIEITNDTDNNKINLRYLPNKVTIEDITQMLED